MNTNSYRQYLLFILAAILAIEQVDRIAFGLLLQNIKVSLDLSDSQLGLLSGMAFALFYATLGVPIGRWADRGNRVLIISATTVVWGITVALTSCAGSFLQLLLIRVGVAVGESGCTPPSYSLIGDYFSRGEKADAMGKYLLGMAASVIVGNFACGWLNEAYGWRTVFLLISMPGFALAMVAMITVKEPRKRNAGEPNAIADGGTRLRGQSKADRVGKELGAWRASAALFRNSTFRNLMIGWSICWFFGYGIGQWQSAFFMRSYHVGAGVLGTWFSLIFGVGGLLATYFGGMLASKYAAGNERLQLKVTAVLTAVFGAITALGFMSKTLGAAMGFTGAAYFGANLTGAPLMGVMQAVVPERMRAISISILYLVGNLIGMGLGPLAVGVLSDVLHPVFGQESLRYALLAMCPGYLWGMWHFLLASRSVDHDADAALGENQDTEALFLRVEA